MNEQTQIYACEYEVNGYMYAMHLYGTYEEVLQHADNLGLGEPEKVEQIIHIDMNNRLN